MGRGGRVSLGVRVQGTMVQAAAKLPVLKVPQCTHCYLVVVLILTANTVLVSRLAQGEGAGACGGP